MLNGSLLWRSRSLGLVTLCMQTSLPHTKKFKTIFPDLFWNQVFVSIIYDKSFFISNDYGSEESWHRSTVLANLLEILENHTLKVAKGLNGIHDKIVFEVLANKYHLKFWSSSQGDSMTYTLIVFLLISQEDHWYSCVTFPISCSKLQLNFVLKRKDNLKRILNLNFPRYKWYFKIYVLFFPRFN